MVINREIREIKRQKRQKRLLFLIGISLSFIILFSFFLKKYLSFADADQKSSCNKDLLLIPPYATKTPRATILDRAGAVLAISQKRALVYAIPGQISDLLDTTKELSASLHISKNKLFNLLNSSHSLCIIKDNLKLSTAKTISNLNLPGIGISYYYIRKYPYKRLAENVIGRIGPSGQGVSGIEYSYNKILENDVPKNLTIGLDLNIESASQRLLKWQMARLRATSGCFLLMNIKDGSLIAMSSYNRHRWHFSENDFALKAKVSPVIMWPILKIVFMDKDQLQDQILCSDKSWQALDTTSQHIAFWAPSSLKFDPNNVSNCKNIVSILASLGFGQKTGIDLPGEEAGYITPISKCSLNPLVFKDTRVSPIQLLVAFSKILSDHSNIVPHVVINKEISNKGVSPLFPKDKIDALIKAISEGHGISLASIVLKNGSDSRLANSKNPAQVVALGFYPTKDPQVVYVLVLNDAKRDPRYIKGVLAQSYLIAQRATRNLLTQKLIKKKFGSFWASINTDKDS